MKLRDPATSIVISVLLMAMMPPNVEKIKRFVRKEEKIRDENGRLFSLVWEVSTDALQHKIMATDGWAETNRDNDGI